MAIDPSIALGIRPLQLADPLAQYSQFAQLQNAQNQNALAQYQLGAAQRADEMDRITSEAYKNSLTPEGTVNYNLLAANLSRGGAGKLVPAVLAAKAEQEGKAATLAKTQAETEELQRKAQEAKVKALGTGLLRGMSNPDDATLNSIFDDLDSNGVPTKGIRQQFAQIPDLNQRINVIRNYALSNEEGRKALEFVSPKTEKFDLDGRVVVFDLNPNSPTYKKEITGFEKTVSPSALLSSQTAIRGQDVAAATAERGQDIGAATAAAGQASVAETAAARLAADVKNWDRMDLLARDQLAAQIENWNNLDARAKATLQESVRSTNLQDARARAVLSETIRNNNVTAAQRNRQLSISEQNAARENDPDFQARMAQAKASGQAAGKDAATAARVLPNAIARSEELVGLLDQMIGKRDAEGKLEKGQAPYQGFKDAVGFGFGTRFIPGTPAANFDALFKQTQGGAFLEAFETLKGGGAISEKEGEKATAARTRMSLAQSEDEFVKAAQDYIRVLKNGVATAKNKLGGTSAKPNVIDFGSLK